MEATEEHREATGREAQLEEGCSGVLEIKALAGPALPTGSSQKQLSLPCRHQAFALHLNGMRRKRKGRLLAHLFSDFTGFLFLHLPSNPYSTPVLSIPLMLGWRERLEEGGGSLGFFLLIGGVEFLGGKSNLQRMSPTSCLFAHEHLTNCSSSSSSSNQEPQREQQPPFEGLSGSPIYTLSKAHRIKLSASGKNHIPASARGKS